MEQGFRYENLCYLKRHIAPMVYIATLDALHRQIAALHRGTVRLHRDIAGYIAAL